MPLCHIVTSERVLLRTRRPNSRCVGICPCRAPTGTQPWGQGAVQNRPKESTAQGHHSTRIHQDERRGQELHSLRTTRSRPGGALHRCMHCYCVELYCLLLCETVPDCSQALTWVLPSRLGASLVLSLLQVFSYVHRAGKKAHLGKGVQFSKSGDRHRSLVHDSPSSHPSAQGTPEGNSNGGRISVRVLQWRESISESVTVTARGTVAVTVRATAAVTVASAGAGCEKPLSHPCGY